MPTMMVIMKYMTPPIIYLLISRYDHLFQQILLHEPLFSAFPAQIAILMYILFRPILL